MGVPAFFRWLCCRNPKFLWDVAENPEDYSAGSLNPDIDNLYLDMNGIIHPCSHPQVSGIPVPATLNDMFINIFNYVDKLMDLLRPKKLIYMAIDGVAPRAKMNQQRARRFRAAQEAERAMEQKTQLRDMLALKGIVNPEIDNYIQHSFDSNQITPGTEFMFHLTHALQYYIYDRLNNDLTIIFSDASIPGEGEHKILQFIRDQRQEVGYDPNTRHCLYGADADLIMLGLSTHEPWFYIIRETVMQKEDKFCTRCQQRGHFFSDCRDREVTRKDLVSDALDPNLFESKKNQTINVDFQMMKLFVVREWLWLEVTSVLTKPLTLELERIVDDFVFMCFLVGNDFLPHIPALKIIEGGIDCLMTLYALYLEKTKGMYITNCSELNLEGLNLYLLIIGQIESKLLDGQSRKQENQRLRREQEAAANNTNNDQLPQYEGERKNLITGEVIYDNQFKELTPAQILDHFKKIVASKLLEVNQQEMTSAQLKKKDSELYLINDHPRPMWKELSLRQRYYTEKFQVSPKEFDEFRFLLRQGYVEALSWTLNYYYKGCVDWGWYYPFHYAPFAQDLVGCNRLKVTFSKDSAPFLPFQQLLGVLPPNSRQFLPHLFHELMTDSKSSIIDFYPTDFYVDLKGKKFAWLGEVVLPFIDAERLIKAHDSQLERYQLNREETFRNSRGSVIMFTSHKSHQPVGVQTELWSRFPVGTTIKSPLPTFPDIKDNKITSYVIKKTQTTIKDNFIQSKILEGCVLPAFELDADYMKECENNIRQFSGEIVKRIIHTTLGLGQQQRQNQFYDNRQNNYRGNRGGNQDFRRRRGDLQDLSNYDQMRKQVRRD